jgi:hypothetical protein
MGMALCASKSTRSIQSLLSPMAGVAGGGAPRCRVYVLASLSGAGTVSRAAARIRDRRQALELVVRCRKSPGEALLRLCRPRLFLLPLSGSSLNLPLAVSSLSSLS